MTERVDHPQRLTRRERWITRSAVMRFEEKSEQWVKKYGDRLGRMDGPPGTNGKPMPLYDACRMSPDAQVRWLREVQYARRSKVVEMPQEATGQLAFGLPTAIETKDCPELDGEQLEQAKGRHEVIRTALKLEGAARKEAIVTAAKAAGVSWRTAYRWLQRYQGDYFPGRRGLEALVDRSRKDKGVSRKLTPAAKDLILRLMTPGGDLGNLTVRQAWKEYSAERLWRKANAERELNAKEALVRRPYVVGHGAGWLLREDAQLPKLSYSTFRGYANEIPEPVKVLTRKGPDAFEKTQLPTSHRDYDSLAPLEYVVMDHRELDVMCVLPPSKRGGEARVGRPWITAAMDMRTRRWLGWHISDGGDSWTIVSVIKSVLTKFGRPKHFYWDNGQDFESEWIQSICETVGVRVTHALPYNARAKSIEPNFRRMASWERMLPEWVGNKSEARPERVEKIVATWKAAQKGQGTGDKGQGVRTLAEIRRVYDDKLLTLNAEPLAGAGMTVADETGFMRPTTPLECWDELMAGRSLERVRPVDLAFLFRTRRSATVRQGEVSVTRQGRVFYYRPMAPEYDSMALVALNSKTVELALDRYDMGVALLYRDGRLVCVVENTALRGMGEELFQEDIAARRRVTKAYRGYAKAVVEQIGVANPLERVAARAEELRREGAEGGQGREVTVLYPEAERARVAVNGGVPVQARPVRTFRPADEGDGEFDFFGG